MNGDAEDARKVRHDNGERLRSGIAVVGLLLTAVSLAASAVVYGLESDYRKFEQASKAWQQLREGGSNQPAEQGNTGQFDALELLASKSFSLNGVRITKLDLGDFHGSDARFAGAWICNSNLSKAHFDGAAMQYSQLRNSNLQYADFRGAKLAGVDFRLSRLTGTDFTDADFSNGDRANFNGTCYFDEGDTEALKAAKRPLGLPGDYFKEVGQSACRSLTPIDCNDPKDQASLP